MHVLGFAITHTRILYLSISIRWCLLPPAPPGSATSSCRKRCPHETAVMVLVENVRTQWHKQTGRQLSVFLCEVIMCSPRCFCSHANEVDRIGNHFQTLSQGKSRNSKTKAPTKGCCAVVSVCLYWLCAKVQKKWMCVWRGFVSVFQFFLYLMQTHFYTADHHDWLQGGSKVTGFSWWETMFKWSRGKSLFISQSRLILIIYGMKTIPSHLLVWYSVSQHEFHSTTEVVHLKSYFLWCYMCQ